MGNFIRGYAAGGLAHLPQDDQHATASSIADMDLGFELILCTFDATEPRIFKVSPLGVVAEQDDFAIIGSGEWLAHSSLCQRGYHRWFNFEKALYTIYEARKLSEREPSVGPKTRIMIINPDETHTTHLNLVGASMLDARFEKLGLQEIPHDLQLPIEAFSEIRLIAPVYAKTDDSRSAASEGDSSEAKE